MREGWSKGERRVEDGRNASEKDEEGDVKGMRGDRRQVFMQLL